MLIINFDFQMLIGRQLVDRVDRVFQELGQIAKIDQVTEVELWQNSHDMKLLRFHFHVDGIRTTFIFGQGFHAFGGDCLDIFYDAAHGIEEMLFTDELFDYRASEVARTILTTIKEDQAP